MTKKITVLGWVLMSMMLCSCGLSGPKEGQALKRPNVILIVSDDQGYGDLACLGNPYIKTPNLDQFYQESVHLSDYHVGPTCAPTRAALMTGRYCNRTGVWHTVGGRSLLRRNEKTMANYFSEGGYRTAIFGKWHLGDNYPYRPQDRGFEEVLIHGGGGVTQTPDYWGNDYFNDTYCHNGVWESYKGYCTNVWFDNAKKFIKSNKNRPFFVYIPTNAPHGPYYVAPEYAAPYLHNPKIPNPNFYGMIANLDENFGQFREFLREENLEDNTILIFMTDNGTAAGYKNNKGYNAGMRGTKGSEYDGGHRVPLFIRYPGGHIEGPSDITHLTSHIDVLPTLMELCGIQSADTDFDGKSLVPLLRNASANWPERTLVTDSQRIEHPEKWRKSATMTDKWRLVNGKELYDIKADPGQNHDLAGQYPEVVEKLRKDYDAWWESVSVDFDDYPPIVVGSAEAPNITLTCHDWHGPDYPWNQFQLRAGLLTNGFWALDVVQEGLYEIKLRRWPAVADTAITGTVPGETNEAGNPYKPGEALAIVKARLKVGDFDQTRPVKADDKFVRFMVPLKKGLTRLQSWFTLKDQKETGAYFVEINRVKK